MKNYKYSALVYLSFIIMNLRAVTYFDMIEDTIASNIPVATATKIVINDCQCTITDVSGSKKETPVAVTLYVDSNEIVREIVIPYKNSLLDNGNLTIICGNVQECSTPILNNTKNKAYPSENKPYSARYIMTWKSKKNKSGGECNDITSDNVLFFNDNDEMLFSIKFDGINKYLGVKKSNIPSSALPIAIVEMANKSKNKTDIAPFVNALDSAGRFKYHYAVYGSNFLYKKLLVKYGAAQGPFADQGVYYNVLNFSENNILSGNNSSMCDELIIFNDQTIWANYKNLPVKISDFNLQSFLNDILPQKSSKPCPDPVPYFTLDQTGSIDKNIYTFLLSYLSEIKIKVFNFNKTDSLSAYSKDYQLASSAGYYTIIDAATKQVKEIRKYVDIKKSTTTFLPPKLAGIGSVIKNSDNTYMGLVSSLDGNLITDIIYADVDGNFINIWSVDNSSDVINANLISGYDNGVSVNLKREGDQIIVTLKTASGVSSRVGMNLNTTSSLKPDQLENKNPVVIAVTKGVVPESALTFASSQERLTNYAFKNAYITSNGDRYILF